MSPIEEIADGIHAGDWQTVCQGYEKLTGEWISPPSMENDDIKDALKQIKDIASSVLNGPIAEICDLPTKSTKRKPGRPKANKKKVKKKIDVQEETGKTRFITNDPDPEEIAKNKERAAKVNRVKRKPPVIYDVECNECGKTFKSDRPDGEMGQKCRKCLMGKKER